MTVYFNWILDKQTNKKDPCVPRKGIKYIKFLILIFSVFKQWSNSHAPQLPVLQLFHKNIISIVISHELAGSSFIGQSIKMMYFRETFQHFNNISFLTTSLS